MKKGIINPRNLGKFLYQNHIEDNSIIDAFEGCLLDNALYDTGRGIMLNGSFYTAENGDIFEFIG